MTQRRETRPEEAPFDEPLEVPPKNPLPDVGSTPAETPGRPVHPKTPKSPAEVPAEVPENKIP